MKNIALLITLITFIACRSDRQHEQLVKWTAHTAKVLDNMTAAPASALPDAILNQTRCLVLVPSVPVSDRALGASGLASCRSNDRWRGPGLVRFKGAIPAAKASPVNVLMLLVSDRASQGLLAGELNLGQLVSAPGATVRETPVMSEMEIRADVLTYVWADGVLSGANLRAAAVSADVPATQDLVGRSMPWRNYVMAEPQAELKDAFESPVTAFFNAIYPVGIILHHSAVIANGKLPQTRQQVDTFHQERGFEINCFGRMYNVGYHFLILPNGSIQPGRPERCQGAHARGYNAYLGISLVGDFSSKDNPDGRKGLTSPTPAQIRSLIDLCERLQRRYKIPLHRILRHSDVSSTECPGDRFPFPRVLSQLERQEQ